MKTAGVYHEGSTVTEAIIAIATSIGKQAPEEPSNCSGGALELLRRSEVDGSGGPGEGAPEE